MARTPDDPSGAKINISIRLSPRALTALDARRAASDHPASRSAVIEGLLAGPVESPVDLGEIERDVIATTEPEAAIVGVVAPPEMRSPRPRVVATATVGCAHSKAAVLANGMRRCGECGAIRGMKGEWRLPD